MCSATGEPMAMRGPLTTAGEQPRSPLPENSPRSSEDPAQPRINKQTKRSTSKGKASWGSWEKPTIVKRGFCRAERKTAVHVLLLRDREIQTHSMTTFFVLSIRKKNKIKLYSTRMNASEYKRKLKTETFQETKVSRCLVSVKFPKGSTVFHSTVLQPSSYHGTHRKY